MDYLITGSLAVIQLLLAGAGIYVSLKPQPESRHKPLIIAFIVCGLLGTGAAISQQFLNNVNNKRQEQEHKEELRKIGDKLLQSQLSQERMKGQLDAISLIIGKISQSVPDPGIKQMASAVEKLVQSSTQATVVTNKQICSKTNDLIKRMRKYAYEKRLESDNLLNQFQVAMRAAKTEEEKNRLWDHHIQQITQSYNQDRYEVRQAFSVEITDLNDELLKRLPPQPKPDQIIDSALRHNDLMTYNVLNEMADYFQRLSMKLCPH